MSQVVPTMEQAVVQMQMMQQQLQQVQSQLQQSQASASSAAALVRAQSAARIPPPPAYAGMSTKLDEWVADIQQQFEWYNLAADDTQLRFAYGFLKGSARDWWTNTPAASRPTTWLTLVAALRHRFQPITASETARGQLRLLTQGKNSVHSYIAAFQRLLISVPDMAEADRLYQFLQGLRPSTATHLRIQGVTLLSSAYDMAARIGGMGEAHPSAGASSSSGARGDAPMDLDSLANIEGLEYDTSADSSTEGPVTRGELRELLNAMRDERRGQASGLGRNARSANGSQFTRGLPRIAHLTPVQVKEYMDANMCFGCGSKDHRSRQCPSRKVDKDGRVSWGK